MKDPLMQEIIKEGKKHNISPVNAIITQNTIIPGISGTSINLNKSYTKIKKLGHFNQSLLVYDKILPNISYKNHYNKIIIANKNNNKISLIFNIKDLTIYEKISQILDKYHVKGNYFFQNDFFINNINIIKKIKAPILVTNLNNLNNYYDLIDYCLAYEISNNIPCQDKQLYTILANINIDKYHLTYTKNNYTNYHVITYTFNKKNINDLDLIINFLLNNKMQIVLLDDLLNE